MASAVQQLQVKVFSPFEVYYEGEASSVSAANDVGPFDILYDHADYISLLNEGVVVVQTPYGLRRFDITRGIIKVHNNYVVLFANV